MYQKIESEPTNGNSPTKMASEENGVLSTAPASAEPEAGAPATESATGDKRKLEETAGANDFEPPVAKRVDVGQREEKNVPEEIPEKE